MDGVSGVTQCPIPPGTTLIFFPLLLALDGL
jgi:hypothetical protein